MPSRFSRFASHFLLLSSLLCLLTAPAAAQDTTGAARGIVEKWQSAVVTLKLVVNTRVSVGGREMDKSESRVETAATVVDPSGLVVLSLSATDPGDTLNRIMPRMGGDGPSFQMETKPSDVKIRFADGREVPATIVLQDKDLDLAFARPTTKLAKPVLSIDLANAATPKILDEVVILGRLGRVANWASAGLLDRVRAVIERPRTLYVPGMAAFDSTGTPVFTMDGRLIGILLLRLQAPEGAGMFGMMGGADRMGILPIILPAADVADLVKQAKEAGSPQ